MCGGGGDGSEKMLNYQKEQDRKRRERREKGMQNVEAFFEGGRASDGTEYEGYGPEFYDERAEAYQEYANPQVDAQFQDARTALLEGLAGANQFDSTAAQFGADRLKRDLDQGRDQVARQAEQTAEQAKQQVANQRQNITNLVQSGADPGSLPLDSAANALDFADSFDPIGNVFQGTTQLVGAYGQGQRRDAIRSRVNSAYGGARSPNTSSGKNY